MSVRPRTAPVGTFGRFIELDWSKRTPRQREYVAAVMADGEFAYWIANPLSAALPDDAPGPFRALWVTRDGHIHSARISGWGRPIGGEQTWPPGG